MMAVVRSRSRTPLLRQTSEAFHFFTSRSARGKNNRFCHIGTSPQPIYKSDSSLQVLLRKAFRSPGVLVLGDFGIFGLFLPRAKREVNHCPQVASEL